MRPPISESRFIPMRNATWQQAPEARPIPTLKASTQKAPEARPIPAWGEAPRTPPPENRGPEARPIPASTISTLQAPETRPMPTLTISKLQEPEARPIPTSTISTLQAPEARPIPAWGEAPRTPPPENRGPEARPIPTSIPKVTLITLNPILLQERTQLILKTLLRMVRFLRIDIPDQRIQIGRPHRKRTIPTLPRKLRRPRRLALQPLGRRRLDLRNQIRNAHGPIQSNREMNVIRNTANTETLAIAVPNNRCQIGVKIGTHRLIENGHAVLRAEHNMDEQKAQRSRHSWNYRSGLRPSGLFASATWGSTPRWYSVAPLALMSALLLAALTGCKSNPLTVPEPLSKAELIKSLYPPRPTLPPPPIHLFHQTDNSITLTTTPDATDTQIIAILYQLRDAAHNHTFDALHIPQKLVDARSPNLWFHLYRGPKCASEKYAPGAPPCGPSYHAAGDYTLGSLHDPNWDSAVLLTPSTTDDPHETQLWPTGSPYTP
jgi:hypothetical protein